MLSPTRSAPHSEVDRTLSPCTEPPRSGSLLSAPPARRTSTCSSTEGTPAPRCLQTEDQRKVSDYNARIVRGAGSVKRSSVRPSVCLLVPSVRPIMRKLRRVCCCGPGWQKISTACCTAGAQQQPRHSKARNNKCGRSHVVS